MSLLLKVAHSSRSVCPQTWTKLFVPNILVQIAGDNHIRLHNNRSENFHFTLISTIVQHCHRAEESDSSCRLFVHHVAVRQLLRWTFSLFPHFRCMGPKFSIHKPLQRSSGVSRGNRIIQYASWCDHTLHAVAHNMEPKTFHSEKARSQRRLFARQSVSFVCYPQNSSPVHLLAQLTGGLQYLYLQFDTNSIDWQHQCRWLFLYASLLHQCI